MCHQNFQNSCQKKAQTECTKRMANTFGKKEEYSLNTIPKYFSGEMSEDVLKKVC